jgi:hypothetical protein
VGLHEVYRLLPDYIEIFWLISAKTLPISVNKNLTLPLPAMVCRPFFVKNKQEIVNWPTKTGWKCCVDLATGKTPGYRPRPIGYRETLWGIYTL